MADIDIDVNPQQSPIDISPNPQQNIIPVEVGEGTAPTYWGQILGDIDNQTDLKERLDSKQDTIVDLDKYLKNDTTQDNGLAVLGTVSGPAGTVVGDNATASRAGVAIGRKAETLNYGVAIGGTDGNTITHASAASVAIGYGAVCSGSSAAQIGMGENTTGGTFQFKDYRLLNADGTIPNDRIPQLSSKANTDLDNLSATGEAKFDAKADTDLSNITSIDKITDALAMDTSSASTIPASTTFTAPSAGWVNYAPAGNTSTVLNISQNASGYISIEGKTMLTCSYVSGSDSTHADSFMAFVGKNQTVYHTMSAGTVYFYPCKGIE